MFEDILNLLKAAPFEPFRIYLNDGRHFDVYHPEFCALSWTVVTVGVAAEGREAHHNAFIQMDNITSVETLRQTQAR